MGIEEYLSEIASLNDKQKEIENKIKSLEKEQEVIRREIEKKGKNVLNVKYGDLVGEMDSKSNILKTDYRFSNQQVPFDEDNTSLVKQWFEDNVFIVARIVGKDFKFVLSVPVSNAFLANGSKLVSEVNFVHDKEEDVIKFEFNDLDELILPIPFSAISENYTSNCEVVNKEHLIKALNKCLDQGLVTLILDESESDESDDKQDLYL